MFINPMPKQNYENCQIITKNFSGTEERKNDDKIEKNNYEFLQIKKEPENPPLKIFKRKINTLPKFDETTRIKNNDKNEDNQIFNKNTEPEKSLKIFKKKTKNSTFQPEVFNPHPDEKTNFNFPTDQKMQNQFHESEDTNHFLSITATNEKNYETQIFSNKYRNDKTFKFSDDIHENEFEKKESSFIYKTPIKNLKEEEIQNRENNNFFKKSPIKQEEDHNKNESLSEKNDNLTQNKFEIEEIPHEEETKRESKQTKEIFDDIIKSKSSKQANFELENSFSRSKNNFGIFRFFYIIK